MDLHDKITIAEKIALTADNEAIDWSWLVDIEAKIMETLQFLDNFEESVKSVSSVGEYNNINPVCEQTAKVRLEIYDLLYNLKKLRHLR